MNYKRIIAVDLGSKRVGLAISDELNICAPFTDSILVKGSLSTTASATLDWYNNYTKNPSVVQTILVGNPLHLSGEESKRSEISKSFCQKLEIELKARGWDKDTGVLLWDERLTSEESEAIIKETNKRGIKGENRKELKDQISAALILQSYLSSHTFPK